METCCALSLCQLRIHLYSQQHTHYTRNTINRPALDHAHDPAYQVLLANGCGCVYCRCGHYLLLLYLFFSLAWLRHGPGCELAMAGKVDLKVVLLGKEFGGKTSLVERYIHGKFNAQAPYQSVSWRETGSVPWCVCVWRDMGMVWTDGWCDRQQCVLLVSCSTQYSCSGRRWCMRCLDCTELCAILCVNIAFKATPCTKLQRFWLHVCMYSKWS